MHDSILGFPSTSGIYKITSPTGKVYVGEAVNLRIRCSYYLTPNRVKKQRAIYNSLVKHGVELHKIEILEFCSSENLLERERYYQEHFCSVDNGLNCYLTPTHEKKKVLSLGTKQLMSLKATGVNNAFYGKKHSSESLSKISESSSGSNNPNYGGKLQTEEYLVKQSISNSKKHLKLTNTITGETHIFLNSKQAAEFVGVAASNIRECKKLKHKAKRIYLVEDYEICTT